MDAIKLHDLVALTIALPDYNLRRGEVGTIVDVGPAGQYLIEFANPSGVPYATPTVSAEHLLKVYFHADLAA